MILSLLIGCMDATSIKEPNTEGNDTPLHIDSFYNVGCVEDLCTWRIDTNQSMDSAYLFADEFDTDPVLDYQGQNPFWASDSSVELTLPQLNELTTTFVVYAYTDTDSTCAVYGYLMEDLRILCPQS